MQYLVTQEPRAEHRKGMVVKVAVVEAKNKNDALNMIARDFYPDECFKQPVARPLRLDHCYRL